MTTPQSLRQMKYVAKKQALGLCSYSGCADKAKGLHCDKHRLIKNAQQRLYYKAKRAIGKMIKPVNLGEVTL